MTPRRVEFGPFVLTNLLGTGAMGSVYTGLQYGAFGSAKRFAIKAINPRNVDPERTLKSFRREAHVGLQVTHPNCVQIHQFSEHEGIYYLQMELVDGWSLHTILDACNENKVRLPARPILELAQQVCAGLQYLHDMKDDDGTPLKFIHRDLKPGNIMLSLDGVAKVTDFGIAQLDSSEFTRTNVNETKGSPSYMAPEQCRGRKLSPGTDLFALGAVLFECITGQRLFSGTSLVEIMRKVVSIQPKVAATLVNRIQPALAPILFKALQPRQESRFRSASEMAAALRAAEDALPPGQPTMQEFLRGMTSMLPRPPQDGDFGHDIFIDHIEMRLGNKSTRPAARGKGKPGPDGDETVVETAPVTTNDVLTNLINDDQPVPEVTTDESLEDEMPTFLMAGVLKDGPSRLGNRRPAPRRPRSPDELERYHARSEARRKRERERSSARAPGRTGGYAARGGGARAPGRRAPVRRPASRPPARQPAPPARKSSGGRGPLLFGGLVLLLAAAAAVAWRMGFIPGL